MPYLITFDMTLLIPSAGDLDGVAVFVSGTANPSDGAVVGLDVGLSVGDGEGSFVGLSLGACEGFVDGDNDGGTEG